MDTGDLVIRKQAENGDASLTELEHAIYCFWVIDYAARNAGSLEAMEDIHPEAAVELQEIASARSWQSVTKLLAKIIAEPDAFEDAFYESFEAACDEIKADYYKEQE